MSSMNSGMLQVEKDLKTITGLIHDMANEFKGFAKAAGDGVKAVKGKGKSAVGDSGKGAMDGSLATFSGMSKADAKATGNLIAAGLGRFSESKAGQAIGYAGPTSAGVKTMVAAVGNSKKIFGGISDMMPDVQATMDHAANYYDAIMAGGNRFGRANVQAITQKGLGYGGVTSAGSDAMTARTLAGMGINISGNKNSVYQRDLRAVGNAARYFNMDNVSAAQAIGGLSTGQGSQSLLSNFGIMTTDPNSGKQLTPQQIIDQITSRLTMGRGKFTEQDVMDSYYKGALGASLRASGLSEDQQYLVVQSLLAKARGKKMDISTRSKMEKAFGANKGNKNPTSAARNLYSEQNKAMSKGESQTIAGVESASAALQAITDAGGELAKTFGALNSAVKTFGGSPVGNGAMNVVAGTAGVLGTALLAKKLGISPKLLEKIGGSKGLATLLGSKAGQKIVSTKAGQAAVNAVTKAAGNAAMKHTSNAAAKAAAKGLQETAIKNESSLLKSLSPIFKHLGTAAVVGGTAIEVADAVKTGGKNKNENIGKALGSGLGMLGGWALGAALAPATGGLSLLIPLLAGAAGSALGEGIGGAIGAGVGGDTHTSSSRTMAGGSGTGVGGGKGSAKNAKTTAPFRLFRPVQSGVKPTAVFDQKYYQGEKIWPNGHNGIDYPVPVGTTVLAAAAGKVIAIKGGDTAELGLHIFIEHPQSPGGNWTTVYAHLSGANTNLLGKTVKAGTPIGVSGKSGTKVTGAHLHFGLNKGPDTGSATNPAPYMSEAIPSIVESEGTTSANGGSGNTTASGATSVAGVTPDITAGTSSGSIINSAITTGVSGVSGNASTIASQINQRAGVGGGVSSGGVGGGESSAYGFSSSSSAGSMGSSTSVLDNSSSGNKGGVVINLTVAQASEAEAVRFAKRVKELLVEDATIKRIGRL